MNNSFINRLCTYLATICLLLGYTVTTAQPTTTPTTATKDTSMAKTNTSKWKEEEPRIYYQKLDSRAIYYMDTSLHTFQRNPYLGDWGRDLGNLGSPESNMLFTPEDRNGPTLGYHVFDAYAFNIDSLNYYNTARAYSDFSYNLGSKLEQTARLMHTQNIRPNWNVAVEYRKTYSPGDYQIERNNHDNAWLTTNYKSLNKHYTLNAAMVYNKEQHDENGGLVEPAELTNPSYLDRQTLDVAYQSANYSTTRSSVFNTLREYSLLVQQSYTWGALDTTYSSDSTHYTYKLAPKSSITHRLAMSTEKHDYKDLSPDSTRYISLFEQSFPNTGTGYYIPGGDSVFTEQKWFFIDNSVMLNGFLGSADNPLEFSAGIGNRYDQFISDPIAFPHLDSLGVNYFTTGRDKSSILSNYVVGSIRKEALHPGEWEYGLNVKFFATGADAGDLVFNAMLGKELKKNLGSFVAGVRQAVNSAPYSYTNYENFYTRNFYSFNKESVSSAYAMLQSPVLRLSAGVTDYVIGNYIYVKQSNSPAIIDGDTVNQAVLPAQYSPTFTLLQVWVRKVFKVGNFYLDNQMVYQQAPGNAPVNLPVLMGRHQLSFEHSLFGQRLRFAVGVEVRYTTNYDPAGYDAVLNKFFYQNTAAISNIPQADAFLNFRIKRFRAFVMGDNLQQVLQLINPNTTVSGNTLLYTGTPDIDFNGSPSSYIPVYAAPDAMLRFGFSWVLAN